MIVDVGHAPRCRRSRDEDDADLGGAPPAAVSRSVQDETRADHWNIADRPPRVLIVALSDDMGSERIISGMAEAGFECGLLCPRGFAGANLRSVSRHYPLPRWAGVWSSALFVRRSLARIVREWRPELILPLDDLAAWLLRGLVEDERAEKTTRALLESSLGHPSGYAACVSRQAFMDLARNLDIAKPDHCDGNDIERSLAAARRWGFPIVVKSDHTCGGAGVRIVNSEADLLKVLSRNAGTSRSRRLRTTMKRRVCRLSGFNVDALGGSIIQPFMSGILAFHTAFAWRGQVREGVSFVAQEIHPRPVGSGTVIRPIANPQMVRSVEAIAKALNYTGFLSVDFILSEGSGEAMAIEFNARSIGSTHLGVRFGRDICGSALLALGRSAPVIQPMGGGYSAVALFPKEMMRAPDSPYLATPGVYHDVPWSEPGLVDRYVRRAARWWSEPLQ
jgi:hypothetical protein